MRNAMRHDVTLNCIAHVLVIDVIMNYNYIYLYIYIYIYNYIEM